jgi:hypothetical protein
VTSRVDLELLAKRKLDQGLILAASPQRENAPDECKGEDGQSPHDAGLCAGQRRARSLNLRCRSAYSLGLERKRSQITADGF